MRLIDQETMQRVFRVTDEIPLSREDVIVPLAMEGEGKVERLPGGDIQITLPDTDDLGPFLEELPGRIARLDGPDG